MAKRTTSRNGHDRLEEAIAILIQNQAAFVSQQAETDKRLAQAARLSAKYERQTDERFARIEKDMAAIIQVLAEHGRLLERLPDALRDKIGFKPHE